MPFDRNTSPGHDDTAKQDPSNRRTTPTAFGDELIEFVAQAVADLAIPGAAVGVLTGREVSVATAGIGNTELVRPVSPATLFQVGSISKTFASAAMMLLCQEGRVALDDPTERHLAGLGDATGIDFEKITIEHLLSHQSGFDGDHLLVHREAHDVSSLQGARRLFEPGAGYSYSNAAFSVIGAIVEAVSGQAFDAFVRARLFEPLGMGAAGYRSDDVIMSDVAAPHWVFDRTPYVIRGAGWQPGWELEPVDHAPGGLIASVEHLVTWCRFHLDGRAADGSVLLEPASLDRLHTPILAADLRDRIALDWFVRDIDGTTTIGHGGVTAGYISDLLIVPESDIAIVCLTNATNGGAFNQRVRRWVLEHVAGLREVDPTPQPALAPRPEQMIGHYLHAFGVVTIAEGPTPGTVVLRIEPRTDGVTWQPPADQPQPCAFVTADTIMSIDTTGPVSLGTFGFDPRGDATWLTWHERRAPRITAS